jgi:hypothetical protein
MMELRPIVVNAGMYILGGNMRCMALNQIQQMDLDSLEQKLQTCNGWQFKTQAEKDILLDFWGKWKDEPFAYIVNAESLTEAEQREFIIKDNIGFGTWDFDKLANEWDEKMLEDWGLDMQFLNRGWDMLGDVDGNPEAPAIDKGVTISVILPVENNDKEDEIRQIIEEALKDYDCEIK